MSELKKIRVAFAEDDGGFARKASHSFLSQLETRDVVRREGHGSAEELGVSTVSEAIGAVRQWQADVALVPYFNSVSGLDDATAQELVKGGLQIVGELRTRTEHALVTSRSAFRTVIETKGNSEEDVRKFDENDLSEDDGKRLSILFVNWLIDIFGHPKSFEQCNSFLSSQGLPTREHLRMQNDPVKMVLRVSELVSNSRAAGNGGFGSGGGFTPILAPVTGTNKAVSTEDLYTVATRGLLPIPSPFIAALAPKDFYQKITDLKDTRHDHTHHDAPEYLKREIIELVHPRLTAFDPQSNVTRFLILARSGGDEDKLVYPIKRALLVCSGDECKFVERKIAFAAELKKKSAWSGLKDKLSASLSRIAAGSKLLPPQFLEHPREQAVVFEAKFPADSSLRDPEARAKSIQGALKRLDGSGQETAKSLKDGPRGVKGVIYLGSYASLADTDVALGDDEVSKTGCAVCDSVRAFAGRLALAIVGLLLLGGVLFGLTQNVDCSKSGQRKDAVCQFRDATAPIYGVVAGKISEWTASIPSPSAAKPKASTTQANRTTAASEQCAATQSSSQSSRVQLTETTLNCPAECNDKCVLEKRPGKAPATRCFRPPSCPATNG